jgi:membrane-bound lytic murein transglycosylase B
MRAKLKIYLVFIVFLAIFLLGGWRFLPANVSDAQTAEENQLNQLKAEQSDLQNQLQEIEKQINQFQQDLKTVQGQKNTLQNKIKQLNYQKSTLELKIKATNLQLDNLNSQLKSTEKSIEENTTKSDGLKNEMSELLKLIYLNDNYPLIYVLLSKQSLSEVYQEIDYNQQMLENLADLLKQVKELSAKLQQNADDLAKQKEETQNLQSIQNLQKQNLADSVSQQNNLLSKTKGQESIYQADLSDAKKQAQEIRNRLYTLLEVQKQINFGQAVQIAEWASGQTGVRPAFLLAILTQESNLGQNVGTCNRAGDPPSKSYKVVMNPTRDQPPFLEITKNLGRDPETTPISCPMHDKNGEQIGWGGAMGPAQFIPSTWMGYAGKVSAITGKTADPWDIRDAFLAAALKLAADGGTSIDGEWAAAMRYFCGGTNSAYSFYGDNVVSLAEKYQADIDKLNE